MPPDPRPGAPEVSALPRVSVDRRWLLGLTLAALTTRLSWVLWIHPPGDYIYSDMHKYVDRAQRLATLGFEPSTRELAWQVWGTHYLLAIPLWLFGTKNFAAAA